MPSPQSFGTHKQVMLPFAHRKFETVKVEVMGLDWLKKEKLAITGGRIGA